MRKPLIVKTGKQTKSQTKTIDYRFNYLIIKTLKSHTQYKLSVIS